MLKPISKEDKPKIIVMSVLVAGLAGTAVYQFTRGDERLPEAAALAAKNPPKDGSAVASASPAPGAPAMSGGTMQAGQAGLVRPAAFGTPVSGNVSETRIVGDDGVVYDLAMVGPPIGGKDPFMPFASAVTVVAPPPVAPIAPPAKPALPFTPPPGLAVGRLDSLLNKAGITSGIPASVSRGGGVSIAEVMNENGGGMKNPTGFSGPSAAAAVVLPPPPPPALMVTGIVVSVPQPGLPTAASVAVMRGAGGANDERRFVRAGDFVGNGFVVAQVRRDSVVIKSTTKGDNRRIVLHLGETLTAVGAASPVQAPTNVPENVPAGETMGKDAPKNADKNTNDKNTVVAPVLNEIASANAVSAAAGSASQLGEFRAN